MYLFHINTHQHTSTQSILFWFIPGVVVVFFKWYIDILNLHVISHTKHFSSLNWTWILQFSSDGRQVRSGIGASWTWAIGLQRTVQCNEHCCFLFISLKGLHQRRDLLLLYYIKNKVKELVYTETERDNVSSDLWNFCPCPLLLCNKRSLVYVFFSRLFPKHFFEHM